MEKKELVTLLNSIFMPIAFKRKGNNWVQNGNEINKIINLQKSQYSNAYYINYGYIINNLPLNNWVKHVNDRLASKDKEEQNLINNLLDLENDFNQSDRLILLHELVNKKIIPEITSIHTEDDLEKNFREREHLYTVAPFVLKYFNIAFEW